MTTLAGMKNLIEAFIALIIIYIILSVVVIISQVATFIQQFGKTAILGALITIAIIWILKEVF